MPTKQISKNFTKRVIVVVKNIPRGQTLSYGQVAKMAGSPRAARAVGSIMAKNFNLDIPCHRVIKSNGTAGEYNRGGETTKRAILESELKSM